MKKTLLFLATIILLLVPTVVLADETSQNPAQLEQSLNSFAIMLKSNL